jgi:cytochrome c oxidase assembly factor CtaG
VLSAPPWQDWPVTDAVPGTGTWSWLAAWPWEPGTLALLVVVAGLYEGGVLRARRRGRPIPGGWALAFRTGIAALAVALVSPLETYAHVSFAAHMAQHLLLILAAPPLLVLGAPISVTLRAARPATARRITRLLSTRAARLMTHPIVGWGLFVGVSFALHLSTAYELALQSPGVHVLEHALWLASAVVYWWPIVGRDPTPRPLPYPARLLSLFLAIPTGSFLALALFLPPEPLYPSYAELPAPWGGLALAHQRAGAIMMWLVMGLSLVVAALLVAVAWKHHEERAQRRLEERADAGSPGSPGRWIGPP